MNILEAITKSKEISFKVAQLDDLGRNKVLLDLADILRGNIDKIILENSKDLMLLEKGDPRSDRLLLNEKRIMAIADDVEKVSKLPSPIGLPLQIQTMDNGLLIKKISVPLGVVAVIYEARPNVTIDVFALCFKSGNSCLLKGGKEALYSNNILYNFIKKALEQNQINTDCAQLFSLDREETKILLTASGLIDVCIPRGSKALIDYVRENATIPVIETGAGVVHLYFDQAGDLVKGQKIIQNAKTRRVSVCNSLDCLLIHQDRLPDLKALVGPLALAEVELFADEESYEALSGYYPTSLLLKASSGAFGQEFLSYKMAIKTVASLQESINHIRCHTSGHSEAIVTENNEAAEQFLHNIDTAVIYINASTAFTDGGEFGMGAEIGISTQKLHARGPMALEALTSYKWVVYGNGHTR